MADKQDVRQFAFNFDDWTGGDVEDYVEIAKTGNLRAMRQFLLDKGACVSWPYAGDPSDPEAWRALKMADYMKAMKAADNAMAPLFRT